MQGRAFIDSAKYVLSAAGVFLLTLALTEGGGWLTAAAQTTEPSRFPTGIPGLTEGQDEPPSNRWLLGARTDEERFRRLEVYAGGTDQQMWQIGYRYEQVYQAIVDEEWALGAHHWGKLRAVFNVALMKRPNRTPNAEAMFLDVVWPLLGAALEAEDRAAARSTFLQEREACIACHVAEGYGFINDAPMFEATAAFPGD
ncbi:MAG: hypothetical protein O3A25_04130 [Acidobacteria bacterium]|nr:hypothetical protein [Acidobacteriota bacterium]